jgi:Uncharacterized conserved protein (some members contain a von Willebrand factor type A (vWA) domain)
MIVFGLVLLVGAWASKIVWLYAAFSVDAAIILFGYLISRLCFVSITFNRNLPVRASEDDLISVEITSNNYLGFIYQSVHIEDIFTAAAPERRNKTIFIQGLSRGKSTFIYQERCYRRGSFRIGPIRLKMFDPFGLFFFQKEIPLYSMLTVYPKIFQVQQLPFVLGRIAPRYGEQTTRISGDYEEFYGIREYKQEDGWRRIHWRSTARLAELTVRHFELSSQWKAMLVLDGHISQNAGYGKDTAFEYSVKTIASLAQYLLYKNASFGLCASTKDPVHINLGKGKNHFYRILDVLAVVQADGSVPVRQCIARYQSMIEMNSTLIIAGSDISPELVKFLQFLKMEKNVGIVPVVLDAKSFLLDNKTRDSRGTVAAMKQVFNRISSQVYCLSRYDDLRLHFMGRT